MKENDSKYSDKIVEESNNIIDDDIIKINQMLKIVNSKKEEGNKLVSQKNYKEAEKIYLEALKIMNTFETKKKFSLENEENKRIGKEIYSTFKNLYSNLALCQGKLLKINEAIETCSYIISNLDEYHDKSYLRIMMWLIEINQLTAAEEIQKKIIELFPEDKLYIFKTAFNLLKIKKDEIINKKKNKIKENIGEDFNKIMKKIDDKKNKIENNETNFVHKIINEYKYITIGVGGLVGLVGLLLLYKYKSK